MAGRSPISLPNEICWWGEGNSVRSRRPPAISETSIENEYREEAVLVSGNETGKVKGARRLRL